MQLCVIRSAGPWLAGRSLNAKGWGRESNIFLKVYAGKSLQKLLPEISMQSQHTVKPSLRTECSHKQVFYFKNCNYQTKKIQMHLHIYW